MGKPDEPAIGKTAAPVVDARLLRRLALQRQGLLQAATFGRGKSGALKALQRLGYVQIDTISVVERAHHHVLRSRVPNYHPDQLQSLLAQGRVFEYWSHAAAFLPMEFYRYSLPRKQAYKKGKLHWGQERDRGLMKKILARIREEGALRSRDFEDKTAGSRGWWEWKPAKQALEQLFMQGDLMVAAREGFQKSYDLPERVLPAGTDCSVPTLDEMARHLIATTVHAQGYVTMPSISYLRRGAPLREAIKAALALELDSGELQAVTVPDGPQYFGPKGWLETAPGRVARRVRILSPFDNSLIQRQRAQQLFNFNYQIECYLPEAKRQYGYFSLPILFGDSFAGRMDCKAHRSRRVLEIKSLHLEPSGRGDSALCDALAAALEDFAGFNQCDSIEVATCSDPGFGAALKSGLTRLDLFH